MIEQEEVLAAERPQLVVTNLMVATAMLNCVWAVTEQGSVTYSEVYLDAGTQFRGQGRAAAAVSSCTRAIACACARVAGYSDR